MKKIIIFLVFLFNLQMIFGQCNPWENHPDGKGKALEQHVIYRDKLKAKKYQEAFTIWQELFKWVQISIPNKSTHFNDGIEMCLYFAKSDTNRTFWLQKADTIWESMFKCNGENVEQRARQASLMMSNSWNLDKVWSIFQNIIDSSQYVPSSVISHSARLSVYFNRIGNENFDIEKMNQIYSKLKIIYIKNSSSKDSVNYIKYWNDARLQFSVIEDSLGCQYWQDKWFDNKDSLTITLLRSFTKKIKKSCGSDNSLHKELSEKLWNWKKNIAIESEYSVLESDTATVWRKIIACRTLMEFDTLNYTILERKLGNYYEELNGSEREWISDDLRAKELYRKAYQLFQVGDFFNSRNYCRAASRWCPNWGEPYILVGLMYVDKLNSTEFEGRTRVWVAIDEWNKAVRVDGKSIDDAKKLIVKYNEYAPTKIELFQRNITEGSVWVVGNWIQQATKATGI